MEATAIKEVLSIYIEKATEAPTKDERIFCLTGFFTYLSTAPVKPLMNTAAFAAFRTILLRKIHEYTNDRDVQAQKHRYHRLQAVMREMFSCLVQDDSVPCRRSARLKAQVVRELNAYCAAQKPVSIRVKVLPRRSARLLARKE